MTLPHLSKTRLQLYASLSSAKMRRRNGLFTAEGRKCVADTIDAFRVRALLMSSEAIEEMPALAAMPEAVEATAAEIAKVSQLSTPPDVIAVYEIPESRVISPTGGLNLLLDGVRDPGNLGTIIRSADWFGVEAIFCSPDCADAFNPKTVQATMGALGRVRIEYADLTEVIARAPELPVYGMMLEGENIYGAALEDNAFIAMGNEGTGLSEAMRKKITKGLLLPPFPPERLGTPGCSESLNVAVATSVTLAEFRGRGARKRIKE